MKKIFTLIVMLAATLGMQAQDTWTVAGQKAILGVDWAPSDATNDMTSTDDVNFTLTKTGMMVKAGDYGYKVVKNHAWDEAYPADNAVLPIAEDGEYTIVFSFNATTHDVAAQATKTGAYVGPTTSDWFVAGAKELMGVEWSADAEDNKMTTEDGKIYKLVKTGVALNVETPYPFKFVQNGSWLGNMGEGALGDTGMGGNFELYVDAPGIYTVTFTANEETMIGTVSAVKTGDAEFGEKTWTICGEKDLCGSDWSPEDTSNDMEKVDEGVFELTRANVELKAKDYSYKVAANHSWGESYGNESGENQVLTVTADGTYDVTFSFIVATKTLDAVYETTGIEAVTVKIKPSAAIYNLQGQRVTSNYRGIAIMDGKKVVMK